MLMDILLPAIPGITTRHLPQHRILSIMLGTEFFHPWVALIVWRRLSPEMSFFKIFVSLYLIKRIGGRFVDMWLQKKSAPCGLVRDDGAGHFSILRAE